MTKYRINADSLQYKIEVERISKGGVHYWEGDKYYPNIEQMALAMREYKIREYIHHGTNVISAINKSTNDIRKIFKNKELTFDLFFDVNVNEKVDR